MLYTKISLLIHHTPYAQDNIRNLRQNKDYYEKSKLEIKFSSKWYSLTTFKARCEY